MSGDHAIFHRVTKSYWALAAVIACLALASGCPVVATTDGLSSSSSSGPSSGPSGGTPASTGVGPGGGAVTGPYILHGHVVTPGEAFDGQVMIDGPLLACVAPGTECEAQHPGVPVFETGGVIAPGLIDTHNHILFDVFDNDDWVPHLPSSCSVDADCSGSPYCTVGSCACTPFGCKYTDHTRWPKEAEYGLMLDYKQCLEDASQGKPVWCPLDYEGTNNSLKCELHKWGSLKGLVAGTTSIVGLPGVSSACFSGLSRPVDVEQNGRATDTVQTSALFPPSKSSADSVCSNFATGKTAAYLIHVGEGVNQKALAEFTTLYDVSSAPGCLYAPGTTVTHGTAFGPQEFEKMAAAKMKLTWSPASNVALYGKTTDIPAALAAGVQVSLAPDWSMGGSQNILDELRFARDWSNKNFSGLLTDKQLVEMVTTNAAAALGLSGSVGLLEQGAVADVVVFGGGASLPYATIVAATPASVRLVLVAGVALYGDKAFEVLAPASPGCDAIDICGVEKFVCVANESEVAKAGQTFALVHDGLEDAFAALDGIKELPASSCGSACKATESCFVRSNLPTAAVSNCGGSCPGGEDCFHVSMSGATPYKCLTVNACAPVKSRKLAPLAPVVRCQ